MIEDRTIALAALLQTVQQVQNLARFGHADHEVVQTAMRSILILDAASTSVVYGGLNGVERGLRLLADGLLASPGADDVELLRYSMALLHLQAELNKDADRFSQFAKEIERLSAIDADRMPRACSDIYQQYISALRPQVIVEGEQKYLQEPGVPEKIRALLLAGIRAAVLWQQKGGGRFKLLWERKRMRNMAKSLLNQV